MKNSFRLHLQSAACGGRKRETPSGFEVMKIAFVIPTRWHIGTGPTELVFVLVGELGICHLYSNTIINILFFYIEERSEIDFN